MLISDPIPISDLKERAKSLGVGINELFGGAIIQAFSSLDTQKEESQRPSQYNACVPVSVWPHDQPMSEFEPRNIFTPWRVVAEPTTDLKKACEDYKTAMGDLREKPYLIDVNFALGSFLSYLPNIVQIEAAR